MSHGMEVDWADIPAPEDDRAVDHLSGLTLPDVRLEATDSTAVSLSELTGTVVFYVYPRTGQPGIALPDGWDMIPGARGCTPQSCAFRDHFVELKALGVDQVFGISTQDTAYQREAAERLHLPFSLLSDADLAFTKALKLPTFEADGMTLLKRLSFIARDGVIGDVLYPIFPPDQNAELVLKMLR
ncbi:MAG: peroxiredoxin [Pseudomonadota bacterium]